jgi:hypothetical protein
MNRLTDTIILNTRDRVNNSIWFVFNELERRVLHVSYDFLLMGSLR